MYIIGNGVIGEELITSFKNKKKNLLVNANKYNPYVAIGHGDGTTEEMYRLSKMYAYLEKGQEYIFSCDVDGIWGDKNGTDTVEVFCFRDGIEKVQPDYMAFHCTKTNTITFTCNVTGKYYIRIDNNDNSKTHIWKNFKIVKLNKKKNLLEGVIWLKGFINQSGTVEENATYKNAMYTEQYIKINSKKTYSANFDITNFRMRCYSNSKEYIGTSLTLNKFPTNTVYIRIVALYGIPSGNLIIKEKKNLLEGAKWVKGFAEYNDKISDNSGFPNALSTEKLIRVNAKNTYVTNMSKNKDDYRIRTFDINKNRIGTGFDYINTDGIISLPEGTVYIRVMSLWRQNVEELYIIE